MPTYAHPLEAHRVPLLSEISYAGPLECTFVVQALYRAAASAFINAFVRYATALYTHEQR
jgi:hypothetical protein